MGAAIAGTKQRRIQLKATGLPKSGFNDGLNGIVNLPRCLNTEEMAMSIPANYRQTEYTHRRGLGAKTGRPVTTSARSETDANTVKGIVQS